MSAAAAGPAMTVLGDIQTLVPGSRRVGAATVPVARVHSDTRTVAAGDLYVAIRGERFDGNDFHAEAAARGATAAIAHAGRLPAGLAGLEVADTRAALGALASGWRGRFAGPLIAVTGSNGKTTVTQMLACILAAWKSDTGFLATAGNFNNDIGLPLTLLRLRPGHEAAVVEVGMNHPGEIARLCAIARPTVALVNNAQREHQEFMASVEAVAHENGASIASLGPSGVAVFPADDLHTPVWRRIAGARTSITFGETMDADIVLAGTEWLEEGARIDIRTPQGAARIRIHTAGRHNLRNAVAAAASALAAGVPLGSIVRGLEAFRPVAGRSRVARLATARGSLTLIDDAYNANPDSVAAAIDTLAALPGPRLLVLGDMGEVGAEGPRFHLEAGNHARAAGIEHVYAFGELARGVGGTHFAEASALEAAITSRLSDIRSVLIKGSRFMEMERFVQAVERALVSENRTTKTMIDGGRSDAA